VLALAGVWLIAQVSHQHGAQLMRSLLMVQFLLLATVLVFSVIARPSTAPHGLIAGIAVMIAVSAMACQYALLRLAMPRAVSTVVMTGNLTNTVLSLMDSLSSRPLLPVDSSRLRRSLYLLLGFLLGCIVAAPAVSMFGDWAWSLPVALSGAAYACFHRAE
jgi:uncharacterized membrane protein YoaK (UPF0700 family)